jgi:hypothetical protein
MKTMRLDEGTVQAGEGGVREMLPICVCGAGQDGAAPGDAAFPVPTCPACGGIQLRASASEQRQLQDFLSAFV